MHNKSIKLAGALGLSMVLASPAWAAFTCDPVQDTTGSPYSEEKFKNALDHAKLQLPTSSTCITNNKIVNYYYDPDNWYLDNTNMQFKIDNGGASKRNELRGDSFAGSRTDMAMNLRLSLKYGGSYSGRFTVAQIYGQTGGQPILRVEFLSSRSGLSNYLWGIYRTNAGISPQYQYKPLGPAPTSFTKLDLVYNDNGTITAKLGDNAVQTWSDNMSYYTQSSKSVYFKTGCYLQNAGDCYVRLSTLNFDT
ncbi:polysaccharide lyase family 7 protein [Tsuneonella flava]|uniref:Polysaccharide lyase family 7 protein n=1 Tax=Tsuneonella flava TaxID=2055955 RepID=A0ABX7KER5_9SPHN|nr:polysaccharide lyase family 7 protein [Tsuneonella flava]QSB45851.1 polysaccharide lyase family 7 protein [Tsuneonella flava]